MKLGFVFLALALILDGLVAVVELSIPYQDMVLGILSILAGIFILLKK